MWLRRLEVTDFRSWQQATVELQPGVTVLVGANAQGKTNLLEAVHRVALGSSHRVSGDRPLVREGAERALVRLEAVTDGDRRRELAVEIVPSGRSRTRLDGQGVRRATDALGVIRLVMFAPEDLALVRGDPSDRRRFLDDVLAQRRPAYGATRSEYERAVRQRNQLLKQRRSLAPSAQGRADETLASWTEQLITHGAALVAARAAAIEALRGPVAARYAQLADQPDPIELVYLPGGLADEDETGASPVDWRDLGTVTAAMHAAVDRLADDERRRAVTLVGPHRDDLACSIGGLPARTHSSQGEAWSLALALRLASWEILAEVGDRPLVCLDDVFSELDETRRRHLAEACADWEQVLVTAAVESDVPLRGRWIDITTSGGTSALQPREEGPDLRAVP
ncbi:MAG: DNA replication/repair protein RecF [Nitriliruptorales bacterium]|nr:DNA replication/repair protein RecF [Nitriliruptorales bacterium]